MQPLTKISKIVIHHSHDDNHTLESIKKLHVSKNGWEDIGYHWLIDKNGNLLQGRSEKFQGAHVFGNNQNSIGICLIGNLDEHSPSGKQIETLINFLQHKTKQYNISKQNILGHNDFPNVTKSCPGKFLNLEEIKRLVE